MLREARRRYRVLSCAGVRHGMRVTSTQFPPEFLGAVFLVTLVHHQCREAWSEPEVPRGQPGVADTCIGPCSPRSMRNLLAVVLVSRRTVQI